MIKITWTDWFGNDKQIICNSFKVDSDRDDALCTITYTDQEGIEHTEEVQFFSVEVVK